MPTNDSELQIQARKTLDAIVFTPFDQCQPLSREFANIPARPGIYAIRHKTDGLLYIGTMSKFHRRGEPMQAKLQEQLSPADAEVILGRLPERIREALIARATEIEYPVEAVIEMAIASFLDTEALGFADCKPGRGL